MGRRVRIEGPIGQVHAMDRIGEGLLTEIRRGKPTFRVPLADALADLALGDTQGQQAFRPNGLLEFLVGHQCRRSTEITPLACLFGLEDRDGVAALAADGTGLGIPTARGIGQLFESLGQIVLEDCLLLNQRLGVFAGRGGAVGADEGFGRRIPGGFSAAGRAVKLALGLTLRGRRDRRHQYRWRDGIGSHWESWVRGPGCEGLFRMRGQPSTDGCRLGVAGFEGQH